MKFPRIKYLLPKGTVTLCLDHKVVCVYLKVTTVFGFIYVGESWQAIPLYIFSPMVLTAICWTKLQISVKCFAVSRKKLWKDYFPRKPKDKIQYEFPALLQEQNFLKGLNSVH